MPSDVRHVPQFDTSWLRRHHRQNAVTWSVLALMLALMLGISFAVPPEEIESGKIWLSPTCPSKRFFGRECPSCGMTRAFAAMSRGRLAEAFGYNRGGPVVYALAWLGLGWGLFNVGRSLREANRALRRSESP